MMETRHESRHEALLMPVLIRLATYDDAEWLPDIERCAAQAFRSIDGLGWLADAGVMPVERHRQMIALSTCWVAVDAEDRVQGFLSAEQYADDLHIHELAVKQSMQRHGVGRQLMAFAMDYGRTQRLHSVTLTTFKDVPWNAPFYQRLGFQQCTDSTLDQRLADILKAEYDYGFAPGSRCAMAWACSVA